MRNEDGKDVAWRSIEDEFPLGNEPAFRSEHALPIPNGHLREAASMSDIGCWYAIGEAWAQIVVRFCPPDPTVLDIGCGSGKLARLLYLHPTLRYVGVDVFRPSILWCQSNFAGLAGDRFRFVHYDGTSQVYNPTGTIRPKEYRLPLGDQEADMTVCASLFTHLLHDDAVHFLEEIHRVSKVGGRALISIHDEPAEGERFSGEEARIDIDREYFIGMASAAGLQLHSEVGNVYGQSLFLFERSSG